MVNVGQWNFRKNDIIAHHLAQVSGSRSQTICHLKIHFDFVACVISGFQFPFSFLFFAFLLAGDLKACVFGVTLYVIYFHLFFGMETGECGRRRCECDVHVTGKAY